MSIRISDLTEESLRRYLPAKYQELPLHFFDVLDSTNTRAKELALDGAPHGTAVMARRQTEGRGRLGRSFFSPQSGIYLSVILRSDFRAGGCDSGDCSFSDCNSWERRWMLMTSAAAVAVAESVEEVCGKAAGIKWVNDIFVDGKKVCGILTEGVTDFETGRIGSVVIGIGINTSLTDFPQKLMEVAGALEEDYSKTALTASVISKLLDYAEELAGQNAAQKISGELSTAASSFPIPSFINAYREKNLVIGKTITVYKGAYRSDPQDELPGRPAKVLDIDDTGGLCIIYTDGTRETLTSGEISIRL